MAREIDQDAAKPSFVADPDVRFGTTFLGLKYRDYSVDGESIMDKSTGEIFTKRPGDGRVVSFFQNKKYTYDLLWRLYLHMVSNDEFTHPSKDSTNEDGIYISTDYDLMTITGEDINAVNMFENNISITSDDVDKNVEFKIDPESNGFFIRITSRDADKAVIEWLTKTYPDSENPLCNVAITYDLTLYYNSSAQVITVTDYCRINDETCIILPDIPESSETLLYYTVKITNISYNILQTALESAKADSSSKAILDSLCYFEKDSTDYVALGYYLNISYFCKSAEDIPLASVTNGGNAFIVTLLDNYFVTDYLERLSQMNDKGGFITAQHRPNDEIYVINNAWAELTDEYTSTDIEELDHDTDVSALELYLAKSKFSTLRLGSAAGDDDIRLDTTDETYTQTQVDTMLDQVSQTVSNAVQNLTATNPEDVTEGGIYIGSVSSEEDD